MRGSVALSVFTIVGFCVAITHAQIFQNFFGGHQNEQREQEAPPSGDADWFEARVEAGEHVRGMIIV
ncbi:hypothetical protein CBS101457_006387 [Exobasidium rhododendri]|nr:hypothetical protein CBS101457_006387 [Exobasidium rhododendri]